MIPKKHSTYAIVRIVLLLKSRGCCFSSRTKLSPHAAKCVRPAGLSDLNGRGSSSVEGSQIFSSGKTSLFLSLSVLHRIPLDHSSQSIGAVAAPKVPKRVKVHPGPNLSRMNWRTDTPMAATLHRTILTEALAVAGRSGCRSTIRVLQIYEVADR